MQTLTTDQEAAIDRLHDFDHTILVADTGVGKTVIALTAIDELIEDDVLHKVIVAAPAKVIENMIWLDEAAKWQHLRGLRLVQLEGTSKERTRRLLTTMEEVDVVLVSLNNLDWLLNQDHECDGIVIDELSKASGKWCKGLRSKKKADRLWWRIGMTATPVSQDFTKLYAMARIIDHGAALGTNKEKYLDRFFTVDYAGYKHEIRPGAAESIMMRTRDLIHLVETNKADTLPKLTEHVTWFDMPGGTRAVYNQMRRDMVIADREAANEAVKSGVLRQLSSGFVYTDEDRSAVIYDRERLSQTSLWAKQLSGRPGLVFYEFVEQGVQLSKVIANNDNFPDIRAVQIASMSHGVDGLQNKYADVLFMQPNWSRDLHEQAIGRVWRQGQTRPVNVTTLACRNTLDELVMARVSDRAEWFKLFQKHLRAGLQTK